MQHYKKNMLIVAKLEKIRYVRMSNRLNSSKWAIKNTPTKSKLNTSFILIVKKIPTQKGIKLN